MSLPEDILTILLNYSAGYKRMRAVLRGYPKKSIPNRESIHRTVLYTTLARLKRNGLVIKQNDLWKITREGKLYLQTRLSKILPYHTRRIKNIKWENKNMVIMFDIPEKYRNKRDWLRLELTILGFIPIQKSVWFGPSPLSRKFITNLHELALLPYIKFFRARQDEIV